MVAEEIAVSLTGGGPWGFRLQGGVDQQTPLQVAKVRRRSKACRAGLREHDELLAIGDHMCVDLSHAQAMRLIDAESTLSLRVKRSVAPSGLHSSSCSPSPRSSMKALPQTASSQRTSILSPTEMCKGITSPPESEAYYGETDSDADTQLVSHRRQRRTPPHARSPARYDNTEEEEASEMTEGEGDSGFQEASGYSGLTCPPLVSPERAKEALMLGSSKQLVPMVGPQQTPVSDELSNTYKDKARQAKLQRGESVVEKQVKEARSKCRSIASLLTDAPNPNSKGVLMFKKRRQRAKKYTLTCFGKAEGDRGGETEGDTGGETEEEGGSSFQSGSEVDEEGFSGSFDPTWDSGYLDLLDRRRHLTSVDQNSKLEFSGNDSSLTSQSHVNANYISNPNVSLGSTNDSDPQLNVNFSPNQNVLNRTARPFTPGPNPSRPSVTSVMFRPPQPKPTNITMETKPVAAISMVTIAPTPNPSQADTRRAVSSTSLYIPPRNTNTNTPCVNSPTSVLSPPSIQSSVPFSPPPDNPAVHTPACTPLSQSVVHGPSDCRSTAQTFSMPFASPLTPAYPPPSALSQSPPYPNVSGLSLNTQPLHISPPTQTSPSPSIQPYINMTGAAAPGLQSSSNVSSPQIPTTDSLATREQRISVPAARTGILLDARKRSNKKPMFCAVQNRDVSPNPDLLSMVQNMDDRFGRSPRVESGDVATGDTGHESGPEEDWLRLGAEACNFMQAKQGPKPPPVAPKPQTPQVPQLAGKGGQLFARRQSRMDRYVVERSPSVAADLYSPAQTREPSPTPSLPATWKYSSNIRAPPPINYNPLLSPSCPPKAQKKPEVKKFSPAGSKGCKASIKPVDIMSHQPYQLNSSLFNYGGGVPQDTSTYQPQQRGMTSAPMKTARVYEVKRFSTPPPTATGPALKVIVPRSATTLGEPMWRSDLISPPTYNTHFTQEKSPMSCTFNFLQTRSQDCRKAVAALTVMTGLKRLF
uniref:Synaptopodin 2-like protein n=1 Tax=Cynoglossus semilaevis TaxID=244447 RepID=A0A3P8VGP6_CYNSE